MRFFLRSFLLVVLFFNALAALQPLSRAQSPEESGPAAKPTQQNPALAAADQLYRSGKFAEAESAYRSLIQSDPNQLRAHTGLVRALLRQEKTDEALTTVSAAITAFGDLPSLLAAKGDVQFRLGQISDAEASYNDAKELDRKDLHVHLGLMRVYRTQSLYRSAYDELRRAHDIAPDDPEVQLPWSATLPLKDRIAALEAYLASPHPADEDQTQRLTEVLAYLKATADKPAHACKIVSKVERTEVRLNILRDLTNTRSGIGLTVALNNQNADFQLDTGATGILLTRRAAEKVKLTRLSDIHISGVGDKGPQTGYTAVADHIRIGELEFQDCVVQVADKPTGINQDGLIGADIFSHFLIDIDVPGPRLILSPLPKREEDSPVTPVLTIEGQEGNSHGGDASPNALDSGSRFKDRYIAPEMSKWTQVFRFGHSLLIPTNVNEAPPALFILDTGAFDNVLNVRAGREVTRVKSRLGSSVRGLSGPVKKVYSAKVTLGFSHLQQSNVDTVAVDLSDLSHGIGTEVSGLLGFAMLQMLDIKLDYRDGLVNLTFDPKRVQNLLKK